MQHTRVKICGITRVEDVRAAVAAGADALGLVFYGPSPRSVTAESAARLVAAVPPFVSVTGLFVDASAAEVQAVLHRVPLDMLQFHGDETPAFCGSFGRPYIKAIRMRDDLDPVVEAERFHSARGVLLDTWAAGSAGGTGLVFDWRRVPRLMPRPVILAGGLNPDNVAEAVRTVRPWAVDVSGGVEQRAVTGKRLPGIKSATAMNAFVRGVKSVRTA